MHGLLAHLELEGSPVQHSPPLSPGVPGCAGTSDGEITALGRGLQAPHTRQGTARDPPLLGPALPHPCRDEAHPPAPPAFPGAAGKVGSRGGTSPQPCKWNRHPSNSPPRCRTSRSGLSCLLEDENCAVIALPSQPTPTQSPRSGGPPHPVLTWGTAAPGLPGEKGERKQHRSCHHHHHHAGHDQGA